MNWYRVKECKRIGNVIMYWCKIKECRKTVGCTSLASRSVGTERCTIVLVKD